MEIAIKAGQLILSLSILVIIHEFGHYFFARLFDTRVEKFYLFFDPWFSLFKFKKGDTEYGIGWIPLGGYVKISGMIDESMDKEQLKQPAQPWEFRSKKTWQRLLIMTGGVVVNFVAAIVIFWMLLFANGEQYMPVSGAKYGLYYNEIMNELGVRDGDLILKADTFSIEEARDITNHILLDKASTLSVKRGDSVFSVNVPENFRNRVLAKEVKFLADYRVPFVTDTVFPDMGAAKGGMQKGDSILMVNGKPAGWYHQVTAVLSENKDKDVTISVWRDTSVVDLVCHVSPKGKIGIGNKDHSSMFVIKTQEYGFFEALPAGISKGVNTLISYVKQLPLIFSKEGARQIGGFGTMGSLFPATWNWSAFWGLTALISVILAFMNILPIPALDGGHVMFLLYEMITGRKPSDKFMEYATIAGMIFLFALLIFANGNDLFKSIFNK